MLAFVNMTTFYLQELQQSMAELEANQDDSADEHTIRINLLGMRDITFWIRYIPSYCGGRFVPVLFRHSRHCCLNPCRDGSLDVKERLLFATFYIFYFTNRFGAAVR